MTIWTPDLEAASGRPLYRALAEAIGSAVEGGELARGERLPTQRELAARLGIALATVTRGYGEAERRGWIASTVGRGTFVRGADEGAAAGERTTADLRPNTLPPAPFERELRESAARLVRDGASSELFDYGPAGGRARHRELGARLFAAVGVDSSPERVLVTAGVQHAMTILFATRVPRGGALLVEERTYAGVKPLAELLGLRLVPVALDGEGIVPEALAAAAERSGARTLYAMSVLQNPTGAVMSATRVETVARVAERLGLTVIEDDTYGFLLPEAPRLAARLADAYCLVGTSKSVFPTLRVGFLHAPAAAVAPLEAAIAATVFFTSPLVAELVAGWIASGLYERIVAWKRDETRARQQLVREALAGFGYAPHPASLHGWLELPAGWSEAQLVAAAAERGVLLSPGGNFTVGAGAAPAVRLVVGSVPTREALASAAATIAELLRRGAPSGGLYA
ncbi:MAG: PLP-dependent aminotransferase family protein [Thermoanaerobaculia bacterium]|nr:PLP-dependent aminotransferase family protein [Thermoanaerobaculia bacterium]